MASPARCRSQAPDDLSLDATQLIYRTAEEGLRNVVAHADAYTGRALGRPSPVCVILRVIDDGCGLDPAHIPQKQGHLGLKALAGLATSRGAAVIIESAPGKGTELRLEVPHP